MKRCTFLFIAWMLLFSGLRAQENHNQERSIKTTDLYLYGEATADTEQDATDIARRILQSKVYDFEPALINRSEPVDKLLSDSNHYISMPRGIKYRTIAFVLKSDVSALVKVEVVDQQGKPQPKSEEPAVVEKDSKGSSLGRVPINQSTKTEKIATNTDLTDSNTQYVDENEVKSSSDSSQLAIEEEVLSDQPVVESEAPAPTVSTDIVELKHDFRSHDELLEYILTIDQAAVLQRLFDEQKRKGMLIYGGPKSQPNANSCYLVYYSREGQVIAFLDKGMENRQNMQTGVVENRQKYDNHPFVWFKLMN